MTYRERFINVVQGRPVDALPFKHAFGLMPGVFEAWRDEGLPASIGNEGQIAEWVGFEFPGGPVRVNVGPLPAETPSLLHEDDRWLIRRDEWGRVTRLLKGYASLPIPLEFPVRDERDWEAWRGRFVFSANRLLAGLEEQVQANHARGGLSIFSALGFYWLPRQLMGDEVLCLAYYDQPELVHSMGEVWCDLLCQTLEATCARVQVDQLHLGEDMAYRGGSLISRATFDSFLKPHYLRLARLSEKWGIPVFSVDSDGDLNELAGWLVECGVNLVLPCEVQAGNDVRTLRDRYGPRLAVEGGIEKQKLARGIEAVDALLEELVPAMKARGGWIASLDHRVVAGTQLEAFVHYVKRLSELLCY